MSTFRHKTIRNYAVGKHEFKNHLYSPQTAEDEAEFRDLIPKLPEIETVNIVELNEEAIAAAEKPISRVVVGAQGSDQIDATKNQTGGALGGVNKSGFTGLGK